LSDWENIAHYNSIAGKTIQHDQLNPTDLHWTYQLERYGGKNTIIAPDGGVSVFWFNPSGMLGYNVGNVVYRIDEPNGAMRKRLWAQNKVWHLLNTSNPNNPYVIRESVTLEHPSNTPSRTAVTDYAYDKNGNVLLRNEYDWVDFNQSGSQVETGNSVIRTTAIGYYAVARNAAENSQNDNNAYWEISIGAQTPGTRRLNAVRRRSIAQGSAAFAATEYNYDSPTSKGNVTTETRWDAPQSGTPPSPLDALTSKTWTRSYDTFGNLTDIYEPADYQEPVRRTHISYDAEGYFPTRVDYSYLSTTQRSWQYVWNSSAGVVNSKTDIDNNITTSYQYDAVGRQKVVDEAGQRRTLTIYDDSSRKVTVKRDLKTHNDGLLQTVTHYDQLGRVRLTRISDGVDLGTTSETDGLKVKTSYRTTNGGACVVTSTPYRNVNYTDPNIEPTLEWKRTLSDQSGRITSVSMFIGSEPNCLTTQYRTGETVLQYDINYDPAVGGVSRVRVIDPANKARDEERDALGRLIRVIEDPSGVNSFPLNYRTTYTYDPLDNLTGVNQSGQSRGFSYNTLGRLTSATNPESGTTEYLYYASGDLRKRTDARSVESTFKYDDLHRIVEKSYSDGTPRATYEYHLGGPSNAPNNGQLKSATNSIASTLYNSYDQLGRALSTTQNIYGNPDSSYGFTYAWWLNDQLKSITYPSQARIDYGIDNAGRINSVLSGPKPYAELPSSTNPATPPYTADGRIARMKLGNDLWETREYHAPDVPTRLKLGTNLGANDKLELEYNYDPAKNNGNLVGHAIRQAGRTWMQRYEYDHVNRLTCVWEGAVNNTPATTCQPTPWSQAYAFDPYGNRWIDTNRTGGLHGVDIHEPQANVFNPANNQIVTLNYDAAGNLIQYDPRQVIYDAENRLTSMTSDQNGNMYFAYDADGRRIRKQWTPGGGSTQMTVYIYDVTGRLAADYSQDGPSVMSYLFGDLLGSVRAVTGEKATSGTAAIIECYDYLPFGRLLGSGDNGRDIGCHPANPDYQLPTRFRQKFTGKERDSEVGLDNFLARYYSAAQGRFTVPDMPFLDQNPRDPQSWNIYSYVRNNPLNYIDSTGHDCVYTDAIDRAGTVSVEKGSCSRKHGTFVNGAVDTQGLTWNSEKRTVSYSYSNSEGTIGTGVIGVSHPGDGLDSKGLAFIEGMAARVDASNDMILTLSGLSTAAGVGAGAYPYAAAWANEAALGPATGRLFFEGKVGYEAATAFGVGRVISSSPLGETYRKMGKPFGIYGWQVLSHFWASGASGSVNIFPSYTRPNSLLWRTELPILLNNPNVIRFWR
jgi:RHS repeat-associated protein